MGQSASKPPAARAPTAVLGLRSAWGAGGLFILSFLLAALASVVPQLFFQHHYPATKQSMLGAALLLSTFTAIAGTKVAAGRLARRPGGVQPALLLMVTVGLFAGLYRVESWWLYSLLLAAVRMVCNYLVVLWDWLCLDWAGAAGRHANDRLVNAFKLVGSMLGPVCFSLLQHQTGPLLVVILILAGGAAAGALRPAAEVRPEATATGPGRPLERRDRLFVAYAILLYGSNYLLGANVIYFLRDYAHAAHPVVLGGLLITGMYLGASLLVALGSRWATELGQLPWLLVAPLCVALSVLGCTLHWSHPMAVLLPGSLAVGAAFGGFFVVVRDQVSRAVVRESKHVFLAISNNLANYGSLIAFGLYFLVARVARDEPQRMYGATMTVVAALTLGCVGLALVLAYGARLSRPPGAGPGKPAGA